MVVVVYVGGAGVYMLGGLEALGLVVDTDRLVTLSTRAQPSDGRSGTGSVGWAGWLNRFGGVEVSS